ncbi:TetR family transcriptional regulator [Labrys miyagiensis]|uniref:TetR family transcriptional regulator n=1 Tax=Labrys miyagiensis TaxID=346912 RepID=A0ABQ6CIS2_9HYPH|nr:TetR/AcrR family transcriptional regulator [Labrys miyagiensis]GLS20252.1 TetR family transcriptional regulator [Labrys miyagiensis]
MKVTREKSAENRSELIRTAARMFRERGIDGVGVAEISKAAGLTHGALYAQFPSKQALAAEALAHGLAHSYAHMMAPTPDGTPTLSDLLDLYLSLDHRDNLADGCAMAASASEIARQDEAVRARFVEGFEQMVGAVLPTLETTALRADDRARALTIVAAMIGGVAVARATAKSRPDLSDQIIAAVRRVLGEVSGEGGAPRS